MITLLLCSVLCANGELRLMGGSTDMEGRVEICINETWGTICDESWGTMDAQVACRSLGFSYMGMITYVGMISSMGIISLHGCEF